MPEQGDARACGRRLVGASIFAGLAGPVAMDSAVAEEVFTSNPQALQVSRLQSPTNDFSIMVPTTWRTQTDSYPGRLIWSGEPGQQGDKNFAFLQAARLPLPALMKSAKFMPREIDSTCSKWEEVALGDVKPATIAKWMMLALQKSIQVQVGRAFDLDTEISDAEIKLGGTASSGSELFWHAVVTLPIGESDTMGLANKVSQKRAVSGKALLRSGVVVFAVADAPMTRFDANSAGSEGNQLYENIAQSLQLAAPEF